MEVNVMKRKPKGSFPSAREEDILHLAAKCESYEDIYTQLGLSKRTVQNQVYRFMKKVGLHKKEHLIKYAQDHGYGKGVPA